MKFFAISHGSYPEKSAQKFILSIVSGAEGKVDESLKAMTEVEELKSQKRMAEVSFLTSFWSLTWSHTLTGQEATSWLVTISHYWIRFNRLFRSRLSRPGWNISSLLNCAKNPSFKKIVMKQSGTLSWCTKTTIFSGYFVSVFFSFSILFFLSHKLNCF